jgi:predicted chitinase
MFNPVISVLLFSAIETPNPEPSKDPDAGAIVRLGYGGTHPLNSVDWSLMQGADSSQCKVELPGDDLDLVDRLLSLKPYSPPKPTNSGSSGSSGVGNGANATDRITHEAEIVKECVRQGVTNPDQIAYILGTARHESDQFATLEEYASGDQYEGRSDLGNNQAGDGRKFKGRGYVQLTGRANYQKYSGKTGKDLIANPEILQKDQNLSRFVLVDGMKNGAFTGAKLGDYTSATGSVDFYNARDIVNGGKDQSSLIAGYSTEYATRLKSGDLKQYLGATVAPVAPQTVEQKTLTQPVTIDPPKVEAGGRIVIRVGEFGGLSFEYLYLISDVTLSIRAREGATLTISGLGPLWSLNQYKESGAKGDLTLKQLAEEIAKDRGLTLDFTGEGTYLKHVESNGITRYQLLLRECSRAGYTVTSEGTTLVCRPIGPVNGKDGSVSTSVPLTDVLALTVSSVPGSPTPGGSSGVRGSWGAVPRVLTEPSTGAIIQTAPTIKTGDTVQTDPRNQLKGAVTTGLVATGTGEDGKPKVITEAAAQSEVSRVKDYPTSLDLVGRSEYLGLVPGNLVVLPTLVQYSGLLAETEFWVSGIHHSLSSGYLGHSLDLYKPGVAVPVAQALSGSSATGAVSIIPSSGGWTHPYPGGIMTAPWGEQRGSRRHAGQDWASSGQAQIRAAAAGTVSRVVSGCSVGDNDCGGGYGNTVDVSHNIGGRRMRSRYAHLASVAVKEGQQLAAGAIVGLEGNTGHSSDNHLHFEIREEDQEYGFGGTIDPVSVGIK